MIMAYNKRRGDKFKYRNKKKMHRQGRSIDRYNVVTRGGIRL